jgi:hypothetical protein
LLDRLVSFDKSFLASVSRSIAVADDSIGYVVRRALVSHNQLIKGSYTAFLGLFDNPGFVHSAEFIRWIIDHLLPFEIGKS